MEEGWMNEVQPSNRRQYRRIKFSEPVQFQLKDPKYFGGCLSADISEGGIRINLNDFVPLNTEVSLQVQVDKYKVVDCAGQVVWIEKAPYADSYRAGVQFASDKTLVSSQKEIHRIVESQYV